MTARYLLAVRGLRERTTDAERQKLLAICDELNISADAVSAVIAHESGWNPAAKNPKGSASGLIQWIESTARGMGTTTDAIRAMPTLRQLDLVRRYYAPARGRIRTPGDALMWAFLPAFLGKPADFTIGQQGAEGKSGQYYAWNAGFDREKKGYITVADVTRSINGIVSAAQKLPPVAVPWPPRQDPGTSGGAVAVLLAAGLWFFPSVLG